MTIMLQSFASPRRTRSATDADERTDARGGRSSDGRIDRFTGCEGISHQPQFAQRLVIVGQDTVTPGAYRVGRTVSARATRCGITISSQSQQSRQTAKTYYL